MTGLLRVLLRPELERPDSVKYPAALLGCGILAVVLLGSLSASHQIDLLDSALALAGERQAHLLRLRPGLVRLILADRMVPPPTPLLAAAFLAIMARREIRADGWRWETIVAVGFIPVLLGRSIEVAGVLFTQPPVWPAGHVLTLPARFQPLPGAFVNIPSEPLWLQMANSRANLFGVWSLLIWAGMLRAAGGGGCSRARQFGVPLVCLLLASLITARLALPVAGFIVTGGR